MAEKTEKSKTIEKTKQPEKSKSAEKSKQPNRLVRFWRETIGELRKVSWPTTQEAWRLTRIVLVVMFLMAVFLGLLDYVFSALIGLLLG
ncbi:preprotein translocase, SecE subunit, bacterial [Bellilinea caldifistulae]|uniref:preprotein translocase subunit SecE n=1 Tax=Bellilinea caldifistulae TaxID=360411 RepID=UPI0007804C10|nr:preprotein translocase subunit SecE [Bellilinea caldifistulae]GAP09047.1 preprotein translocase, SecE subunit, bacterial [Bellilinea caldifistulae]